jgi:hypothetical protein
MVAQEPLEFHSIKGFKGLLHIKHYARMAGISLQGFPPRLQAIFDAVEYLSSDDEFWPALVAAAEHMGLSGLRRSWGYLSKRMSPA